MTVAGGLLAFTIMSVKPALDVCVREFVCVCVCGTT